MGYWSYLYKKYDKLWNFLPLIDPDFLSYLSVLLSFLYFMVYPLPNLLALIFLLLILLLDVLDGVMARRIGKKDEEVDLACDRISELLIFLHNPLFLFLSLLNIWLSVVRMKKKIPIVLPVRQIFLFILIKEVIF